MHENDDFDILKIVLDDEQQQLNYFLWKLKIKKKKNFKKKNIPEYRIYPELLLNKHTQLNAPKEHY